MQSTFFFFFNHSTPRKAIKPLRNKVLQCVKKTNVIEVNKSTGFKAREDDDYCFS